LATLGHIIHRPADIIWRLVRISNLPPSCPFVCPADGSILRLEKKKTPIDIDLNAQKVRNPVIYLKMIQFSRRRRRLRPSRTLRDENIKINATSSFRLKRAGSPAEEGGGRRVRQFQEDELYKLLPSSSALEHFGYCNDDWDG
jgi:hypothetical protein